MILERTVGLGNRTIGVNLVILVCLNQDFQDYRIFRIRDLYANVPLQKVALHPLQGNIYLPTPNPVHLGSDNVSVIALLAPTYGTVCEHAGEETSPLR